MEVKKNMRRKSPGGKKQQGIRAWEGPVYSNNQKALKTGFVANECYLLFALSLSLSLSLFVVTTTTVTTKENATQQRTPTTTSTTCFFYYSFTRTRSVRSSPKVWLPGKRSLQLHPSTPQEKKKQNKNTKMT